ncbi:MAG: peptidylprolyl isomerase, partial [Acutalibacteraceae bacterium]|nr:peptidylprolyl isomerase [Acutalibacteraceae bacterium]
MTKTVTKFFSLIMALALAMSCLAFTGCGKSTSSSSKAAQKSEATIAPTTSTSDSAFEYTGKKTGIEIKIKDYGTIEADLYDELAPITVENFKKLVNENFYEGLIFHRVIEGFMIQGG